MVTKAPPIVSYGPTFAMWGHVTGDWERWRTDTFGVRTLGNDPTQISIKRETTTFTAIGGADFAFIAVGTPSGASGEADMRYCEAAARSIAHSMTGPLIIVNKSTMPIGAGDWITGIVSKELTGLLTCHFGAGGAWTAQVRRFNRSPRINAHRVGSRWGRLHERQSVTCPLAA